MQFKNPEYLYALCALIIPILIHLFQLRRFQKVPFTNVQFLKLVTIQTRKSSRLKKWLTLLARLLAFAALIIAFAQPFLANNKVIGKKNSTAIYLDNSFSMQARGAKGPLLQRAVQELLNAIPEDETISVFTNTETFKEVTKKDIQNDLLQLEYTSNQMPYDAAYLKAKQLVGTSPEMLKRIIMVSDFQQKETPFSLPSNTNVATHLVKLQPVAIQNISIDSLFLNRNSNNDLLLNVLVSNTNTNSQNTPIAIYNDEQLIAKTSVSIPKNETITTQFKLNDNRKINGRVIIEDPLITFDNSRYFTINTPKKIKVIAINDSSDLFLKNIFTEDEFELTSNTLDALNYNDISTANLVVVNEIKEIPISLINALKSFTDQGGIICFIPSEKGELISYQQLLQKFSPATLLEKQTQEKKVTTINFSHPLYKGVFDKRISNFQYPKVLNYYTTNATNTILSYEDKTPFLFKTNALYVFTASINSVNSNFKNSPLIVPTLYNIGKQSLQVSDISYTIGEKNSYDVAIALGQDGIISLESEQESVIPLQQNFATKVHITTKEVPSKAGIYSLKNKIEIIQNVSYNYDHRESNMNYYSLASSNDYEVNDSITTLFDTIKEDASIHQFWKWFIIFALIFLLIEILLLKYLK